MDLILAIAVGLLVALFVLRIIAWYLRITKGFERISSELESIKGALSGLSVILFIVGLMVVISNLVGKSDEEPKKQERARMELDKIGPILKQLIDNLRNKDSISKENFVELLKMIENMNKQENKK